MTCKQGVLRAVAVVVGAFAACCSTALPAQAAEATFRYTGGEQTFVVPEGVYALAVTAYGARGGTASGFPAEAGGLGAMARGTIAVLPGETLYVEVGGRGQDSEAETFSCGETFTCKTAHGGFNGGGDGAAEPDEAAFRTGAGGGGASDLQRKPIAAGSEAWGSRLVVAGGGGGAGAPANPEPKSGPAVGGWYAVTEEAGGACGYDNDLTLLMDGCGGEPGTPSGAGAGGKAADEKSFAENPESKGRPIGKNEPIAWGGDGSVGEFGYGGTGGVGARYGSGDCTGGGGGGGGGGYYGGGGGAGGGDYEAQNPCITGGGGGGGQGSSYVLGGGGSFGEASTGVPPSGNGLVTVSWTAKEESPQEKEEHETTRKREEREAREAREAKEREAREAKETPRQREEREARETNQREEKGEAEPQGVEAIIGTEEPPFKVKLGCKGVGAAICKLQVKATVDEEVVNGRIVAVTARHPRQRHGRRIHRIVVIGEATVTLDAGQSAAVPVFLNAEGRKLRHSRRTLKLTLEVLQTVGGDPRRTVMRRQVGIERSRHRHAKPKLGSLANRLSA